MEYPSSKELISSSPGKGLILLSSLFLVLSCTTVREAIWPPTPTPTATPTATPTPTPTNTPTPTRVPIAERDFRDIVLQKSDLPDPEGFVEFDIPDIQGLMDGLESSPASPLLENLEAGYAAYFTSNQEMAIYANLILVYLDGDYAVTAYEEYVESLKRADELDIPLIGEASIGVTQSSSGMTTYVIVWRYQEAILDLEYVGEEDIGVEEMIRMAQAVQARLETG